MDKRGFLRIVEASIAIMIIIGVLFVFFNQQKATVNKIDLSERARNILEEVSKDVSLREDVLNNDTASLDVFISNSIPENFLEYEFKICGLGKSCGKSTFTKGDVFSAERSISSTVNRPEFDPKKIRLFIWEKEA